MFDDNSEYVLLDSVEITEDELELVLGGQDTSNYDTRQNNATHGGTQIDIKPVSVDVDVDIREERFTDGTESENIYAETFRGLVEAATQGFQNSAFIDAIDNGGARFAGSVSEFGASVVDLFDAGVDRATEFIRGNDSGK